MGEVVQFRSRARRAFDRIARMKRGESLLGPFAPDPRAAVQESFLGLIGELKRLRADIERKGAVAALLGDD